MNLPFFIARRWSLSAPQKHTRQILRMGVACIALCVGMMVLSACVLVGFKQSITQKVFGFGSHLQIQPYSLDNTAPYIDLSDPSLATLQERHPQIKRIDPYIYKEGLIKGKETGIGVFFKGLPQNFDTAFFADKITAGRLPRFGENISNEILISEKIAQTLELHVGDKARTYFMVGEELRGRALSVVGLYKTGLSRFDEIYIMGDLRQIQRLDNLNATQVSGLDLQLYQPQQRVAVGEAISLSLPYEWSCYPCDRLFPDIFDWLALIDVNAWVLMVILWVVALISLLSVLFICVISRKPHAAMLRCLGMGARAQRRVFLYQVAIILGKGLLLGNLCGLLVAALQWGGKFIRLNEDVYFLTHVPIAFPWTLLVMMNLVCLVSALTMLWVINRLIRQHSLTQDLKSLA